MKDHNENVAVLEGTQGEPAQLGVPATALQYAQMRLLAECAAGLGNGREAVFGATGRELQWMDEGQPLPPETVLVPAADEGKFPAIGQVSLAGMWTPPAGGAPVSGEVNAVDFGADALFWSDSAVQKFVVPYVASCGGAGAAEALGQLQGAWNHYPTDSMGMFALMHRAPAPGEVLELNNALALVRAAVTPEGGTFGVLPLSRYAGTRSGGADPGPETALFQQSMPLSPFPGYQVLRAIAEWSASLTAGTWYFTVAPGMTAPARPTDYPPQLEFGEVMIPVHTPSTPAGRPRPASVVIQPEGGSVHQLLDLADSVFWSTGSIQQFLLPYYASVRGMAAPDELRTLVNCWQMNVPHRPEFAGSTQGSAAEAEDTGGEVVVFALVHLPMSAWMTEEELEAAFYLTLPEEDRERLVRYHRNAAAKVDRLSALRQVGVLHRHRGATHLLLAEEFTVLHPQVDARSR